MRFEKSVLLTVMIAAMSTSALAQDWVAERLRGTVVQWEKGAWAPLDRGDIVPDGLKIRTEADGRVELVRGNERISLGGSTQISLRDAGSQKMTSIVQTQGSVTVEAERRNVQHFSVQTPVLAAVVKGTQFTVTYRNGQARVEVERGVVQVQDSSRSIVVDISQGQTAEASQSRPVDVTGPRSDRAVFLIEGNVVPAAARAAVLKGDLASEDAVIAVRDGNLGRANANVGRPGQSGEIGNAGDNGNGNAGGGGNGNAEGNGNGNAGGGSNGKAGDSGNGNAGGGGNGNAGDSGNGNAGGGGNGNAGGNGNGNAGGGGNGNAGGNGNGNAGGGGNRSNR